MPIRIVSQSEESMARIIENDFGRRMIKVTTDDIVNIVREYQRIVGVEKDYEQARRLLDKTHVFLPED